MRTYAVPAKYQRYMEAAIAVAITDVQRDMKRARDGDMWTIRPSLTEPTATGDLVIMVGVVDMEQQAADLAWPDAPDVTTTLAPRVPKSA